jgi:hypothetical protein
MMVRRLEDWPARLASALQEARGAALEYGRWDCCVFCANMVQAITGVDPAAALRGRYATEQEAYALMRAEFGGGIPETVAALAHRIELEEIPVALAGRGDVVLVGKQRHWAAGVVSLSGRAAAVFHGRLAHVPLRYAQRAWRV